MNRSRSIPVWLLFAAGSLILVLFKVIPLLYGFLCSLKEFSLMKGFFGSPWIGLKSYIELLGNYGFRRIFFNSVSINVVTIVAGIILALLVSWGLNMIYNMKIKRLFAILFLIPFFIPSVVYAWAVFKYVDMIKVSPGAYVFLYASIEAVRTCGAAVMIVSIFIWDRKTGINSIKYTGAGLLTFVLVKLSSLLSSNFDISHTLVSPLLYESGDVFDTFVFRTGLATMNVPAAEAAWFVKYIVEMVLTIASVFIIRRFITGKNELGYQSSSISRTERVSGSGVGIAVCSIYTLFLIISGVLLFLPGAGSVAAEAGKGAFEATGGQFFVNILMYFIIILIVSVIGTIIAACMAYPLTVKGFPVKILYILLIAVCMYSGTGSMHQYILFRSLGIVNTIFPVILISLMPLTQILVFAAVYHAKAKNAPVENMGYASLIAKPAAGIAAIQFSLIWNTYQTSLIYSMNPQNGTPVFLFRMLLMGGMNNAVQGSMTLYALMVSIPPVLVFLAAAWIITPSVMLGSMRKL